MQITKVLLLFAVFTSIFSCKPNLEFEIQTPDSLQINKPLTIKIAQLNVADAHVRYFIDDQEIANDKALSLDISAYKLGQHVITVKVEKENQSLNKTKTITFLANKAPKIYTYKVINSYPHDRKAYTQGLEFYKNELYEGTGKRGKSVLRKVELDTGEILSEQPLANKYFGEGITIFNDKIYQLTWQSKLGFIYDLNTFKPLNTFHYQKSQEGWGLTHNKSELIKSDGTEKIWFLEPETGKEKSYIEVYSNKKRFENINELEYIHDRIYANIWTYNAIAIINPKNGMLEALVNMKGLAKKLDNKTIENSKDKVLNGIAYNPTTDKLYVTGKNWDKIFEIEIIEK